MTRCLIALGSNLGDRLRHLTEAVATIDKEPDISIVDVSALYETAPVGGPERQGPYLNAALLIETSLPARRLLATLHRIEADHERERLVRWGARTLDLDLLTYGDDVSDDEALLLPHPRMHLRRFVMVPVCDVAADLRHPQLGRPMETILAGLPAEPDDLTLVSRDWAGVDRRVDKRVDKRADKRKDVA